VYLLNAVLFVLVGLQLHPILSELSGSSVAVLVGQAALVSAVVIAVRVGWGFTVPYLIRALDRRPAHSPGAPAPESGWWRAGAGCAGRCRWRPRWPCR
jgi:NhaP-type Na+/H+ or K+/H+ antiporter